MDSKSYFVTGLLFFASLCDSKAQIQGANWLPYFTDNLIKVEYKEVECHVPNTDITKEMLSFRITNLSANKVEVTWQQEQLRGSNCLNCDGSNPEMSYTLLLSPNSTEEGDCDTGTNKGLMILNRFISPEAAVKNTPVLTRFKIKNINVTIK